MAEAVKLVECPRDAWQGLPDLIPTEYKAEYLKQLVLAGYSNGAQGRVSQAACACGLQAH